MEMNEMLYGSYRNKKFTDVYSTYSAFNTDYISCGIPAKIHYGETSGTTTYSDTLQTLYYLLYAYYGNSTIASSDENQFKYQLFAKIFQFGPAWEKRLEIQELIKNTDIDAFKEGTKEISNHAYNPGTAPGTASLDEILEINDQSTANVKRGTLETYTLVWDMIQTDVTQDFLDEFRPLFLTFVSPEKPLFYYSKEEDEDDD